jgi:hypothetical protein
MIQSLAKPASLWRAWNFSFLYKYILQTLIVIAVEPEGNRRDCNTMEK